VAIDLKQNQLKNTASPWRVLDAAGALVVHGFLLHFLAGVTGYASWAIATCFVAAVSVFADVAEKAAPRVSAVGRRVYTVIVAVGALSFWLELWLISPVAAAGVALLVGWLGVAAYAGFAPTTGLPAAAALATAAVVVAESVFADPLLSALLTATGVTPVVAVLLAGRVDRLGRRFYLLFLVVALCLASHVSFWQGGDRAVPPVTEREGVTPVIVWNNRPLQLARPLSTRILWAARGVGDRLVFGSPHGIFLLESTRLRQLPVGPAGRNLSLDESRRQSFAATETGELVAFANEGMVISAQEKLAAGGRLTRLGSEGVFAVDGDFRLTLRDRYSLATLKSWPDLRVNDVQADGQGGFFAATVAGDVLHVFADGEIARGAESFGPLARLVRDQVRDRLFVVSPFSASMAVLDAKDLNVSGRIPIGYGAGAVLFEPTTQTVLVGRIFAGEVVVIGAEDRRELARLDVGRRVDEIMPDGQSGALVAASGGVFAINLAKMFPELAPEKTDP
jgi:hypothetical protein